MKDFNEQEFNKKCAELIGAKPCKDWQGYDGYEHSNWYHTQWSNRFQDNLDLYSYKYSDLKFHSDWNWIMQIVEKIEVITLADCTIVDEFRIESFQVVVRCWITPEHKLYKIIECTPQTKKEAVIQAIDQFLDWYNEQKI